MQKRNPILQLHKYSRVMHSNIIKSKKNIYSLSMRNVREDISKHTIQYE